MSVPVPTAALADRIDAYGAVAYVLTVDADGRPHSVSVPVVLEGDELVSQVGRTTAANAAARPTVTYLWPPTAHDPSYALIVDGVATVATDDDGTGVLRVAPTRAVQHRQADADPTGPSCITVGDS